MSLKFLAGIVAISLFAAYFGPILIKLKDFPLGIVLLGGIALVVIDFLDSIKG